MIKPLASNPLTFLSQTGQPVKLISIKIKGLFEIFDYDIAFPQEENALIITGPNGFGKTMILNIIFNLFEGEISFFDTLPFSFVALSFSGGLAVEIKKLDIFNDVENSSTGITFFENGVKIGEFRSKIAGLVSALRKSVDISNNKIPERLDSKVKNDAMNMPIQFEELRVHIVREQRLLSLVKGQNAFTNDKVIESIKIHAATLMKLLALYDDDYSNINQSLDGSYPMRLRSETQILTKEEYQARYSKIKEKQIKLANYDLYELKIDDMLYSAEDAKALSVYLKDLEKKLSVFDELLQKLDIFTEILNERRFTFKKIRINREKGFFFESITGKELELSQLSSGEQHEIILLYELIFNVDENTLVLIDEPEISLHISWQKEFLADLLRIIALQKMQVIVATHSPAIVNGRWDLTYNLEKTVA
jgi:predicted ATP-binding protein involved in virulence